ncbi:MAG: hypothetical protein ACOYUK_03745 [Patescibacteria group bacterium]
MIAIQNIEKYFDDHPELADQKEAVLAAARERVEKGTDVMVGHAAAEALGELARDFFREIEGNLVHQEIGLKALSALNKR